MPCAVGVTKDSKLKSSPAVNVLAMRCPPFRTIPTLQ
jgi:hypothetical protein